MGEGGPPVSNTPESTALASSKISKLKSRWIFLRQAATLMLGGCWHVGLPKAKTPDNRPKWQVIYHIQPFLAVYSCLCCHYDDDHEASLPAQDMQQASSHQLFLHQRFPSRPAPCRTKYYLQGRVTNEEFYGCNCTLPFRKLFQALIK